MDKNKNSSILEEVITPRVIVEQIVRICCVIGLLIAILAPLVVVDALGSVAPTFSSETSIPLNVSGDSQTQFVWYDTYLIQNSTDTFLPTDLFRTGAQWITSTTGAGASILGVLGLISTWAMYIIPILLYIVLMVSRHYEGNPIDSVKKIGMPVCCGLFLLITIVLGIFCFGYLWNFSWEYDTHNAFFSQFFMAYGGIKITVLMVISFLISIGCGILTVFDKKHVD